MRRRRLWKRPAVTVTTASWEQVVEDAVRAKLREAGAQCKKVHRIYEPAQDGSREVLYETPTGVAETAYVWPDGPAVISVGW